MTSDTEAGMDVILQRRLRAYELALDTARRDAVQAAQTLTKLTARIAELELELSEAREAPGRLEARLAEQQRARRAAEQRAYAERAYREELQLELASIERGREQAEDSLEALSAAGARRRELEAEVGRLRRQADEAEHIVVTSRSARQRAERRMAEVERLLAAADAAPGLARIIAEPLAAEFAVARLLAVRPPSPGVSPPVVVLPGRAIALERELIRARGRPARGAAVATVPAGPSPARFSSVLRELRAELNALARLVEHERTARRAAEARADALTTQLHEQLERSASTYEAIDRLRGQLSTLSGAAALSHEPAPATAAAETAPVAGGGAVEPERFAAALTRLRQASEPEPVAAEPDAGEPEAAEPEAAEPVVAEPVAEGPPGAWLRRAFGRLAGQDPSAAGELALALLPLQRHVYGEPVTYDIDLDGTDCRRVAAGAGGQLIELAPEARPPDQVRFSVTGDRAGLGRLLAAGRLRRRFGRGLAKVHGDRAGLMALDAIIAARVTLRQLREAGVELEPELALALAAAMIDPAWTAGSAFTLAHRPPGAAAPTGRLLVVDDGRRVTLAAASGAPTATIVCAPKALIAVLDAAETAEPAIDGPHEPLIRVQRWIKRAQSG